MGRLITSIILEDYRKRLDPKAYGTLVISAEFTNLVSSYPVFGADIALCLQRNDRLGAVNFPQANCHVCNETSAIDFAHVRQQGYEYYRCYFCGQAHNLLLLRVAESYN
jgi:hypothetical protein